MGLPRPSLDSMRTTNNKGGHYSEAETDYDEEDDYYDDEEAEAEALLSRRHGEAAEASNASNTQKTKRGAATDQDIADEYAQQDKERKKKARRKVRTITPEDLIKPLGLTVVRNGIAPKFQAAKYSNTQRSMAKFSRRLISSYSDWMDHLTGGLSLHETQWKLKTMGSKTQIKQYLQDMRKSVRDDHVERLLGLEQAQRLLGQLEDYYNAEHLHEESEEEDSSLAISNPYAQTTSNDAKDDAADTRASSVTVSPTNTKPTDQEEQQQKKQKQKEQDDPLVRRLALQKEHRARKHVLEDSDDEEEALFDDAVPAASQNSAPTSMAARRHVLDDDSDDEEDDNQNKDNDKDNTNNRNNNNEGSDQEKIVGIPENEAMSEEASMSGQDEPSSGSKESIFNNYEEEEATPTTNGIGKLDEKFQSVKALLEGGNLAETAAAETEEISETAILVEGEPDVDEVERTKEDDSLPDTTEENEAASQDEFNAEDGDNDQDLLSPNNAQEIADELNTVNETNQPGDEQDSDGS